ncbi:hypothetical protein EGW08_002925 [Elysia chlorotica]|uniref:G-protein coupled receptors family 1 profile domain-containing protein n=1 Tax=Elysia chlorotica TaxID=188477 RepID=A0A3S1BQU3_ELYCH|nr:hypothetical protein EGW08_002925 [Elysia chlorotica]
MNASLRRNDMHLLLPTNEINASIPLEPFMSYKDLVTMNLVLCPVINCLVVFGICTNVANVLVYYRIGFSSPSTISLFCLSITDTYCLIYISLSSIGILPWVRVADYPIALVEVAYILSPVRHSVAATGSWITAVINVERSCCVVFPMKVKSIFTRKTIISLIAGMVVYQVLATMPRSLILHITKTKSQFSNRMVYKVDPKKYDQRILNATLMASNAIPTFLCFLVVVVGTIFLIYSFKKSRALRHAMTRSKTGPTANTGSDKGSKLDTGTKMSEKDRKLIRSVIAISSIYIFGETPHVLFFCAGAFYPPFNLYNPYFYYFAASLVMMSHFFQAVSYSVNFFVYLNMSSKFKQTFKEIFPGCLRKQ